jgi:hypothetical protein
MPASFITAAGLDDDNTFTGTNAFTNATSPIVSSKIGPTTAQQHTVPAVTSDTVALLAATQTLTNKTLTSPVITSPTITGGVRQLVPFGMVNIAAGDNATPASSTPVQIYWCGVSALTTCAFTALRAGSVTGLSVSLNGAAAGSNLIVGVYKNGTIINASAIVTLASGTSDTKGYGTFTLGSYTFVAGDVIDVRIRTGSGWSATTVDAAVSVEIAT